MIVLSRVSPITFLTPGKLRPREHSAEIAANYGVKHISAAAEWVGYFTVIIKTARKPQLTNTHDAA